MISLRQFKQFIAVAEELNFNRAAKRLFMSQPPLSAAIQKLEEELGVLLIERSTRSVELTKAGTVFLVEARRTLAQAERTIHLTQQAAKGFTDSLRLSFVDSTLNTLLPRILVALKETFNQLDFQLQELTTADQLTALQQDQIDLGIVVLPVNPAEDISLAPLLNDRMMLAVPDTHPLASQIAVNLDELAQESWIIFSKHYGLGFYNLIMKACAEAGFSPNITQTTKQMQTTCSLVAAKMGIALVPRPYMALKHPGIKFLELKGIGAPIPYNLAIAYKTLTPLHKHFIELAQQIAADLYCV